MRRNPAKQCCKKVAHEAIPQRQSTVAHGKKDCEPARNKSIEPRQVKVSNSLPPEWHSVCMKLGWTYWQTLHKRLRINSPLARNQRQFATNLETLTPAIYCASKDLMIVTVKRFLPGHNILTFCWLLSAGIHLYAQVSPGPLSKPHEAYDGILKCSVCHSIAAGKRTFKCLACHTEIFDRLKENKGFHAKASSLAKQGQDCVECHEEHAGEGFNIIQWKPNRNGFDHNQTGYGLQGKHAGLDCQRCHNPTILSRQLPPVSRGKNLQRTYLGLSTRCYPCHEDQHKSELGTDCAKCHSVTAWKPASSFDHQRSAYPLTDLHLKVSCQKCHLKGEPNNVRTQYRGLSFSKCSSCHVDPHRGAFVNDCQSCHVTSGWKQVQMGVVFDHSRTKYPLRGKHASVLCIKCHLNINYSQPVPHNQCRDCHKPDPHRGQFERRSDRGECAGCHNEEGFKPSLYTAESHQQTAYPLKGKHLSAACSKCHIPAGAATLYRLKFAACLDCHQDAHHSQFAGTPHQNQCEACHTLQGFSPSTFTIARHKETRFPLAEGHIATPCSECHKKAIDSPASMNGQYRFDTLACEKCHTDPHEGQFVKPFSTSTKLAGKKECEICHTLKSWTEIIGFDHNSTEYPLLGVHRSVDCKGCHHSNSLEQRIKGAIFKNAPKDCAGCHEDIHEGQFAKSSQGSGCAACHQISGWRPTTFDHEKNARFSLAGAHQRVPCRLCHSANKVIHERQVLVYGNTPGKCISCHAS
jgi:hypothetical protein